MDLKSNRRSRRENEKYVEPLPLLIKVEECMQACDKCGEPVDIYPAHTHLTGFDISKSVKVYPCTCHKCAAHYLWKQRYPLYTDEKYQAEVERDVAR